MHDRQNGLPDLQGGGGASAKMLAVNLWQQRVLRDWIDNKWSGIPAFIWDVSTVIGGAIAGGVLGLAWGSANGKEGLPDVVLVVLWAAAGLAFGWLYVIIRRPS